MVNDQTVACIVSYNFIKRIIIDDKDGKLPVSYQPLADSVFAMWDSGEIDQVILKWGRSQDPSLMMVNEDILPDQPSTLSSEQEIKFGVESNRLSFRDLQEGANDFCGDSKGFGSEFWLALEFDNKLVTGRKVPY